MSVMPTYAEAIFGIINLTEEVEYHKDRADRLAVIADALAVRVEELESLLRSLLNKVNRVTAPHRHGTPIRTDNIELLSLRQIEVEARLRYRRE